VSNLLLLTGIIGLVFLAMGFSSPLLTIYLQELGASYWQISLILTSYAGTALISNYAWGWLTDRMGRRKPLLLAGLLGLGVVYWQLGRVPNANFAWGIRVLEGMATAAYTTPSLALMGDLLAGTGQRGRRMGYYRGSASMMFAVGAFFGGSLADQTSIGVVLTVCAGIYMLAAVATLFVYEPAPVKKAPIPSAETLPPSQPERPLPLLFLTGAMLWTAAHGAGASMWPNYMAQLGYAKTEITRLWGLAALVEFPSMAASGVASDVIGRAPLLIAGGTSAALVHIGYVTLASLLPALLIIQIIRGFAFGSFTTTGMTFAAEWGSQQRRGRNSGGYNAANGVGGLMGTFLGGTIVQLFSFGALYALCAALAAGSAVAFVLLRRQQKQQTIVEEIALS